MPLQRLEGFVRVQLLESSIPHVGSDKLWRAIAGSLLAFAAQLSFNLGFEGFLDLSAKTHLIEHYRNEYGFEQIGRTQKMILTPRAAANLILVYNGGPTDEQAP